MRPGLPSTCILRSPCGLRLCATGKMSAALHHRTRRAAEVLSCIIEILGAFAAGVCRPDLHLRNYPSGSRQPLSSYIRLVLSCLVLYKASGCHIMSLYSTSIALPVCSRTPIPCRYSTHLVRCRRNSLPSWFMSESESISARVAFECSCPVEEAGRCTMLLSPKVIYIGPRLVASGTT
ncbi:hypothetical protein BCV70DRAFT_171006 [Testicularia cyperi]|uniref:Uncharacterized protein n=1 Tax=Testicularia cyperi TaxID=1882483 RepID=A0A317XZY9_9BASI|nr:hypothetical protein BCV70DRAFT_171006 [Testicularia cyperi]